MCQKIVEHYRAGFPVFLLKTSEMSRVKYEVEAKLSEFKFKDGTSPEILSWSITSSNNSPPTTPLQGLLEHEGPAILFLYNYHWFIDKPPVIQTIQDCFSLWANQRKAIVMVSHTDKIPPELERDVTVVDLKLPTPEEIEDIVKHESPTEKHLPTGDSLKQVVASSKGLSRRELQNVYNLSLIQKNSFDIKVINEYRSQAIKKSGLATVVNPDISIDDIIGYDTPKDFVLSTINNPEAKGVIFIGPPGCGKTSLIKAFAGASGKLTLMVNTGSLFSKYQGETDKNVKALVDLAWSLGESYFVFDEMEKQFSGVGGSGDLDSGVTSRAISQFLDFFQNRPPGCYIGATCNSFKGLPPEYLRAGRWDTAPIFIDLPSKNVQKKILDYYIKKFKLKSNQVKEVPAMPNWTGSEIETLCHNAKMLNRSLMEVSKFVLPIYNTMKENIEELRQWSIGRCIKEDDMFTSKIKHEKKRRVDI